MVSEVALGTLAPLRGFTGIASAAGLRVLHQKPVTAARSAKKAAHAAQKATR